MEMHPTQALATARDTATRLVREQLAPLAAKLDCGEVRPVPQPELLALLLAADAASPTQQLVLVAEAVATGCATTAHLLFQRVLLDHACRLAGDSLPEPIGSIGFHEPGPATTAATLTASATQEGTTLHLSGGKRLVPASDYASTGAVVVSFGGAPALLAIPCGTAGLHVSPGPSRSGARGVSVATVSFDRVQLPHTAILGREKLWSTTELVSLLLDAAYCLGVAEAAKAAASAYAVETRKGKRTLAHDQEIHFRLADMQMRSDMARLLLHRAAWAVDSGQEAATAAESALLCAWEAVRAATQDALEILGVGATEEGSAVDRHARDGRVLPFGFVNPDAAAQRMATDVLEQVKLGKTCSY